MAFLREPIRVLPDGSSRQVMPFHLSLEGMRTSLMCINDEDYDSFVKYIFICAIRANVIVVSYAVVSNHAHILLLAPSKQSCYQYGDDLKRVYGMYYSERHHEESPMGGNKILPLEILTDKHLRNAMAYIPRNAEDNGEQVSEYRWSSFSAYFRRDEQISGRRVSSMSTREAKIYFRTNLNLKKLPWKVDGNGCLIPGSACDYRYVEDAFLNDEAYFFRLIGNVNVSEMRETLELAPKTRLRDRNYRKEVENLCQKWFQVRLSDVSRDRKIRLITHMARTRLSGIPQMARVFGMEREEISRILDHGTRRKASAKTETSGNGE